MLNSRFIRSTFKFITFASPAGGLRNCNAAVFASFKKYAAHFLNTDFVGTEPKNAANAVTDLNPMAIGSNDDSLTQKIR